MVGKSGAQLHHNPIAIVGMASIFPNAANLREYWDNILRKIDCIIDVPSSRWNIDDYYDPDPTAPDKVYCKRGGFLPEIDFDPLEFGLPPNILEVTDTSQLLSLVVARDALADAGYGEAPPTLRERTGVVLGVGGGQKLISPLNSRLQYPVWEKVLKSYGIPDEDIQKIIEKMKLAYVKWEENAFPGALGNVVAGRIANRLDLGGMNTVVDAACASSLSALNLAVAELVTGHADMMITGGVDTDNSVFMYMCFSKTPAFSRSDRPRPFDASSDGMMVGEGIGMVVLKRLEDAERDGDRIYAVIKGVGTSSDGRYKSIYAPRSEGQERALRRAYEDADFLPATVGLIEAHGTGTVAGDIAEAQTLLRYFGQETSRKRYIALGSVKAQMGHTKAAAGIAGLIKTSLALYHKVLPPMINIEQPNPKLNLDESPFYLNTEARPWLPPEDGAPRRAGVSAFGFGGTNFHIALEEYTKEHKAAYRLHSTPQIVILFAQSPDELRALCEASATKLQSEEAQQHFQELIRKTPNIPLNAARVGFVAETPAEARELLLLASNLLHSKTQAEEWQHPKGVYYRKSGLDLTGKVVALFSGQGSQYLEMGRELALNFPVLRDTFGAMDELFAHDGAQRLSEVVFPPPVFDEAQKAEQVAALQRTEYAQPAIGAFSAGLYKLLQNAGFRADFLAGHSFGELTALWASGTLSDQNYFALVRARGRAMAPVSTPGFDAGTMLAVTATVSDLEREVQSFPGVVMANLNSPNQVVLAGPKPTMAEVQAALKSKGYNAVPLSVSAAFHTPLVGHAQGPFAEAVNKATFRKPQTPVYSNATGQAYPTDPEAMQRVLTEHLLKPVQFQSEIENIYSSGGYLFVEFGPRNILTNLVNDILEDKPHIAIALNGSRQKDSDRQLREAVVRLAVIGLQLNAIDPYPVFSDTRGKKRKGMTMRLNGANFVSEKTRAAFEEALADGSRLSLPQAPAEPVKAPEPVIVKEVAVTPPTPVQAPIIQVVSNTSSATSSLRDLEQSMARFSEQQREMLRVHEQYLNNQAEYFRIFYQLTQQQQALLASGTLSPQVAENLTRNMTLFHDHQAETLRVHEQYLHSQGEGLQSFMGLIREQYAALVPSGGQANGKSNGAQRVSKLPASLPAIEAPAPAPAAPEPVAANPAVSAVQAAPVIAPALLRAEPVAPAKTAPVDDAQVKRLSEALLQIVSEKTGYPAEMLELGMDLEADLGIDSIKRVEILGAMHELFPELPQLKAEELGELRTLQQIVDYMRAHTSGAAESAAAPATAPAPVAPVPASSNGNRASAALQQSAVEVVAPAVAAPLVVTVSGGVSADTLSAALLAIVSEKTGYPAEMLELGMDLEADLGIDSIKRVEILGAMREQFPDLPQLKAEELGELRTLQQIVDYMRVQIAGAPVSAPVPVAAPVPEPVPVPAPVAPAIAASPVVTAPSGVSAETLSTALLAIVSEKTGYPAEMLEMGMDLEADLGIDSIKRVEILGTMREQFPDLPQLKAEELGELRTLQQIVDYMRAQMAGAPVSAPAPVTVQPAPVSSNGNGAAPQNGKVEVETPAAAAPGVSAETLSTALLAIVSEKTGYPAEMLEMGMDLEADLGIDSIKRVEILGAMREQFPDLPQLKAEELGELRTLQQIVDYMRAQMAGGAAPAAPLAQETPAAWLPTQHDIPRSDVRLKYLPEPDYLDFDLPQGAVCLITDDGSPLTARVAQTLAMRGWKVVVLAFPQSIIAMTSASALNRVVLPDMSEVQLKAALDSISSQFGPVGAFIHINPASQLFARSGSLFLEQEKAIVKHVFLMAKYLKEPLNQAARAGRSGFLTVARLDGALGISQNADFGAIPSGFFGLTKTLNLEWESVFCRAIDLAAALPVDEAAQYIIAELHDPNRMLVEVAHGAEGRVTLVAEQANLNETRA